MEDTSTPSGSKPATARRRGGAGGLTPGHAELDRGLDRPRILAERGLSGRAAAAFAATGMAACVVMAASGGAVASMAGAMARRASDVPLVVYSAQGYDKAETQAFSKQYHIPVQLDDNSTGPLLTQIEASRNNPRWGLLWVDGATAFAGLDTQGLLLRGFEPKVSWNSLGKQALPKDESYVPTGVTLAGAMAYNASKVSSPPTSWGQLLSAKWKGQIGTNDPTQSGPTYPFIAGLMNYVGSIAKGERFFLRLKQNGLVVNPTNGPTLAALASGQINIALVQSSAAIGATFSDRSLKVRYLNPVTILPSAIGIDAKASKQEQLEAEQFVEFVLSPAGQKVMQSGDPTGDSLYYPVLNGVAPLKALPPLSGVRTQNINPYVWGPRENTINAWFEKNIVQ
ncbi:MAG: extracellular solute-binding protein [Actinomycetota bacterium]|nr:extracellular solute-binding protein [Actinomycetota bacterium]